MPDSLISAFKVKLDDVDFNEKFQGMNAESMIVAYEKITATLHTETFPEKKIILYNEDKPWFNEELRTLKRKRLREYTRHG